MVATEQRVGEAHVYTLPGRMTLRPGETSGVALFEPLRRIRKAVASFPAVADLGGLPQYGEETPVPVEVSYRCARTED
jgi:hypothetical protein